MTKNFEQLFTSPDTSGFRTALTEMNLDGRRIAYGQKIPLNPMIETYIKDGAIADGYDKEGMFIITRIIIGG